MSLYGFCINSIFFFLILSVLPIEAKELKQVLIIYSQDKWHPAHEITEKGFRSVLDQNPEFDIRLYAEYLDLANFSSPAQQEISAKYIRKKYSGLQLDSIVTVYDTALDFAVNEGNPLFPGVPIIASQLSWKTGELLDSSPLRGSITGTIVGENMSALMQDVFRLFPRTENIALICGSSLSDQDSDILFRKEIASYKDKIQLIDLTQLSLKEILQRVATLPPHTVVLYGGIFKDGAGNLYVPREVIAPISKASNSPVFGLFDLARS